MYTYLRHTFIRTFENFYYYFLASDSEQNELLFERMDLFTDNNPGDSLVSVIIQLDDKK